MSESTTLQNEFWFSRPERRTDKEGYIAFCSAGGAVSDYSRLGVEVQINYWMQHQEDWKKWVANIR